MSKNLSALVEAAIFAAVAMVLSFIPDFASWFSPSFGAIPLVCFSLRRGLKFGLLSGLLWGLMHFILGKVYYLTLSQVLIEYILAFISMGFAGLLSNRFKRALKNRLLTKAIVIASFSAFIAVFIRYFWHFIAGYIFWGSYAKNISPLWYSFTVNGIAGLSTLIIVVISLCLIIRPKTMFFFLPTLKRSS